MALILIVKSCALTKGIQLKSHFNENATATILQCFNCTFATLKVAVYILSIYLFYLCCYACTEACCIDKDELVQTAQSHDDCADSEACTPFCFDQCCAAHIICEVEFASLHVSDFNSEEPNGHLSESHFQQVSASIWQPPKI